MILVDSSVWIDYFNGNETKEVTKLDLYLSTHVVTIGDIILTEVLQGFKNDRDYQIAVANISLHQAGNFAFDKINNYAGGLNEYAQQYCQSLITSN
jgi:predicted nucleic acid-binding protein